jgi:hypothetical protein
LLNKIFYSVPLNAIPIEMDSFFPSVDSFFTTIDALASSFTEYQDVPVEFDSGSGTSTVGCVIA